MSTRTVSILVVDDNEMNCDMLARRLEKRGYAVTIATDGQAALNCVLESPFDLVLLDIEMHGLDGLSVLKLLRKTYSMTALPVIMVTARDQSEDIVQALELGANDYVTKPLDFNVVAARVQTQLGLKHANDEVKLLAAQLEARNELIRNVFGRYVDSEVVDRLLQSPEMLRFGGELRKVTILFTDVRGFTLMSEQLKPDQIVTMLNGYFSMMIETVARHGGIVDELIGDGILAFFGAPDNRPEHASRAIAAALEIQRSMEAVNVNNRAAGLPELKVGIGINTGEVVVGNIGSERRSKYSVVGKHVNLASRITGYSAGGQVFVSETTLEEAGAIVRIDGVINVLPKGVDKPVSIYEIGGLGGAYNLFLPRTDNTLYPIEPQIPVSYTVLDANRILNGVFNGSLVRLSLNGGEIRSVTDRRKVAPFSDVRIHLGEQHDTTAPCLYGKVLGDTVKPGDSFCVRFTCLPPETAGTLNEIMRTRRAN